MHAEFIKLRNERFDVFQLIQRIFVFCGCLHIQGAVAFVDLLHRGLLKRTVGERLNAVRFCVMNGYGISVDGVFAAAVAQIQQPFQEGVPHAMIREADAHIHGERIRCGKFTQPEAGQPPVQRLPFEQDTSVFAQHKAQGKTFRILCAVIEGAGEALRADVVLVSVVDSNLRSCGNSVLALPQFDHPALSRVGKTDGFAVHHHIEQGGALVIELTVSHFPLPAVHERIENISPSVIGKAGFRKISVQGFLCGGLILCGTKAPRAYFQDNKSRGKRDYDDSGDTE